MVARKKVSGVRWQVSGKTWVTKLLLESGPET
jgi:hypothetical protein